jgi:hypothetical protein
MEMPFVQSFSFFAISSMQIPNQKLMLIPQKGGTGFFLFALRLLIHSPHFPNS